MFTIMSFRSFPHRDIPASIPHADVSLLRPICEQLTALRLSGGRARRTLRRTRLGHVECWRHSVRIDFRTFAVR